MPGIYPNGVFAFELLPFGLPMTFGLSPFGLFWTTRTFGLSPFHRPYRHGPTEGALRRPLTYDDQ